MTSVCEMWRFGLLLLASSYLSSFFASALIVFTDASDCIHLRCEWRGSGEHCKPSNSLNEAYERKQCGRAFEFLHKDEADADLILRIKRKYLVNTFTIVNDDVALGEMCEKKQLCCNVAHVYYNNDYAEFLEYLQNLVPGDVPKLQC